MLDTFLSSTRSFATGALVPGISLTLFAVLSTGAAGCTPSAPDSPTWAEDVAPIMAANCVRCHTVPAIGGAPDSFRLDTYEDWVGDDGRVIRGAGTMTSYIMQRIEPRQGVAPMPPEEGFAELTSRQVDVLRNWAENLGGDRRAAKGPARDDNRAPEMTVDLVDQDDGTLAIDYRIDDPDGDIVTGELVVGDSADGGITVSRELHSGSGRVIWDVGTFAPGSYSIFAVLRDTSGSYELDLADHDIANGDITPTVTVRNLRRDTVISDQQGANFSIELEIQDADFIAGENIELDITATLGDTTLTLLDGQATVPGLTVVIWDLTDVEQGTQWRLQVTVRDDDGDQRKVEVGPFIIGKTATTETFATMTDDFFSVYCTFCHPFVMIPGLTHDFALYQAADGSDVLGARDLAGEIFRRVVEQRNMPPASNAVDLDPAVVERLKSWLLAGAPE